MGGAVQGETSFSTNSSVVTQLPCETPQGQTLSSWAAPAKDTQCLVLTELSSQSPSKSWLRQKSLPLVTDWSIVMQMRTLQFGCPKGTVLIGQNRATLIGQSCAALIGWGKPQSYWLK